MVENSEQTPFELLRFERREAVAWITLQRPKAMNSLSIALIDELERALGEAESDPSVRALAITGAPPAFCAGADLKEAHRDLIGSEGEPTPSLPERIGRVFNALEASPLPVIAAVNGLALAGGFELVLCCDLVVAAQSARLGDAHVRYGLLPGAGGSVRLPRKIGPTRAKQLLYTGEFVPAAELVSGGLVNRVVPDEELTSAVQALGMDIASKSPLTISRVKKLVDDSLDQPLHSALQVEIEALTLHAQSEDVREGLAAFIAKRKPRFVGR